MEDGVPPETQNEPLADNSQASLRCGSKAFNAPRMTSNLSTFKFLPLRLGIARIGVHWRFLLSTAVMAAYLGASHIIYNTEGLSFAEVELTRTPFRLVAAFLFWLLMADVIFAQTPDIRALKTRTFAASAALFLAVPLLVIGNRFSHGETVIVAVTALPVALCEELFFRGILQTTLVRRLGVILGIVISVSCFVASHFGTSAEEGWHYALLFLAGFALALIYLKTGSMIVAILLHGAYDALFCVMQTPPLPFVWAPVFLLWSCATLLYWVANEPTLESLNRES
jgi:membrane protease YdiL (CAAX protease family)